MPVTAKLSQAFYDRLGHQVADEMVEWFNQVDLSYRHDLRELNELNFEVRFERRLGEQSRWLAGIWITVIGAAVALWFRR